MKCAYCGRTFNTADSLKACEKCSKSGGCTMSRCPYCYHEFIPEPKWVTKLVGLFRIKNKELSTQCRIMSLNDIQKGSRVKIINILSEDILMRRKIMAMGLLPGITIDIIQKNPSCVIKAGESQFAIDNKLAEMIEVENYS